MSSLSEKVSSTDMKIHWSVVTVSRSLEVAVSTWLITIYIRSSVSRRKKNIFTLTALKPTDGSVEIMSLSFWVLTSVYVRSYENQKRHAHLRKKKRQVLVWFREEVSPPILLVVICWTADISLVVRHYTFTLDDSPARRFFASLLNWAINCTLI